MEALTSSEIRNKFLHFFEEKKHAIVPSAPIVLKNDPTLLFTNAGMNQFKDYFLGNAVAEVNRVADTQKCLRVSGKHNDLEEVGVDTYHHTMFEMLGNWSFGDYFKKEAIDWAWELLTDVFQIPEEKLYITVFGGDKEDGLAIDEEAIELWGKHVPKERILPFGKKDNFWEMGDTGPCGPCSEIHIDLRTEKERQAIKGAELVNQDHPQVIEIWNLVFIQFNRLVSSELIELPAKHVDTGMGFERLCRVIQGKTSNYDTDLFMPLIRALEDLCHKKYGKDERTDIAFRVISDHIRAVAFCIADGQLPSNTGAGYVVRRILRRAVRYAYSFLDLKKPTIHLLVKILVAQFKEVFAEVEKQEDFIIKVVREEEAGFLKTLESGLKRFDQVLKESGYQKLNGRSVFELYDTYGFPVDLTRLLASENGAEIDEGAFEAAMNEQKQRSKADATKILGDWVVLEKDVGTRFLGYDNYELETQILKYRTVQKKGKPEYHIVLKETPFYAEGGGQKGDKGVLKIGGQIIKVLHTIKENDLILHLIDELPNVENQNVIASVDVENRINSCKNHSATHLVHAALKQVLGKHVNQKGSLLNGEYLRFDFSHFEKVSDALLKEIEQAANQKVFESIALEEHRAMPKEEALALGANALFGEKYGKEVRVVIFDRDFSIELCGGTHVQNTSEIGLIKIVSESSVAAGVRRIEALTGKAAFEYMNNKQKELKKLYNILKGPKDAAAALKKLMEENSALKNQLEVFNKDRLKDLKQSLLINAQQHKGIALIVEKEDGVQAADAKKMLFEIRNEHSNAVVLLGGEANGKALLSIGIGEEAINKFDLNAGNLIREMAKEINGGGGGQPFFATAGGSNPGGTTAALELGKEIVLKTIKGEESE